MNGEKLARRCAEQRLELNRAVMQYRRTADGWKKLARRAEENGKAALADECRAMAELDELDISRLEREKEEVDLFETGKAMELAVTEAEGGSNNELLGN